MGARVILDGGSGGRRVSPLALLPPGASAQPVWACTACRKQMFAGIARCNDREQWCLGTPVSAPLQELYKEITGINAQHNRHLRCMRNGQVCCSLRSLAM